MSGSITFNPYTTITPNPAFLLETQGYIQGVATDDPASRPWLKAGWLATTETVTMWGGVPISELINLLGANAEGLGPSVKRATSQTSVTGWSVFNQAAHMVIVPGNAVPLASITNGVHFYRLGTNARIIVKCDPALLTAVTGSGDLINQPAAIYWDVVNYQITTTSGGNWQLPTSTRLLGINTNSKVVAYNSGTFAATWVAGTAAEIQI